jgi:hypothetical protein
MTSVPAVPPHTNARVLRLAKSGSSASVRIGRFMSNMYDSALDTEWRTTCPGAL